jgi:serine/threonine protein kinase
LTAAHDAEIVHRDLKPGNIFLSEIPGGASFVKLLDFGISKRTGGSRKLTGQFDILGTPDYMAPEQASGKTALVDHRGDQFSLAVIAYQMLTGALPFAGNDVMEILRRVMLDTPAAPSVLNEELPKAVDEVFARALSKDPDQRYCSILDFARDLARQAGCSTSTGFSMNPSGDRISGEQASPSPSNPVSRSPSWPNPEREVVMSQQGAPMHPATQETIRHPTPVSRPAPATGRITSARRKGREDAVSSITAERVGELLDQAREALGNGAFDHAVDLAEQAHTIARSSNDYLARRSITGSETLLLRIYEKRLGSLSSPVVINGNPRTFSDLSPESAFLLSRLDGGLTFEEALDLSAMPRQEALRHLVSLMRAGFISAG